MKNLLLVVLGLSLSLNSFAGNKRTIEADNVKGIQTYVNYVKNATGQENTAGWATYADAAGVAPVDGTGGAPTLTWTRNTTTPLFLEADFLLTHTAANEQGNGVSYGAAIDLGDRGTTLGISFFTLLSSGTYTNNDLQVFAYDVTNAALLNGGSAISLSSPVATTGGIVAGASVSPHFGSIYVPPTCASVRFIIHQAATNTTAYNIQFSKISLNNNPFVYKNLLVNQTSTISQAQTAMTDITGDIRYNLATATVLQNTGGGLFSVSDNATATVWTALKDCKMTISAGGVGSSNGTYQALKKNNVIVNYGTGAPAGYHIGHAVTVDMGAGDYLSWNIQNLSTSAEHFMTTVSAIAESEHVITPAKNSASDAVAYTPTFTGFGTPTNVSFNWSREGQNIHIRGYFTSGTTTAAEARISLPSGLTTISTLPTTSISGRWGRSVSDTGSKTIVIEASRAYFCFGYGSVSDADLLKINANAIISSGNNISVDAIIPISGWSTESQFLAALPKIETCYIKDVKANATNGGTATTSYAARDLNTLEGSTSWVSLASNKFTLRAGKYKIKASVPAYDGGLHVAKLYNETTAAYVKTGSVAYANAMATHSNIFYEIELTTPTQYSVHHRAAAASANGWGLGANFGDSNIYTQVEITRLW